EQLVRGEGLAQDGATVRKPGLDLRGGASEVGEVDDGDPRTLLAKPVDQLDPGEVGDAGVADQQVHGPELAREPRGGAAIIGMKRAEPRPAQRGEDLADDHGVLVGHDDVQAILLAWRAVGLHCSPWTREASREWQVSTAWKIAGCTCLWVRTAPPPGGKAAAAVAAMCHRRGAEGAEGSEPGVDRSSSGSDRDAGLCGCEGSGNRASAEPAQKAFPPIPACAVRRSPPPRRPRRLCSSQ